MLFDPTEKQLDLPALLINRGNGFGGQENQVGCNANEFPLLSRKVTTRNRLWVCLASHPRTAVTSSTTLESSTGHRRSAFGLESTVLLRIRMTNQRPA